MSLFSAKKDRLDSERHSLSPRAKKWMAIGGMVLVGWTILELSDVGNNTKKKNEPIEHVLTDNDSRELGMDSLIAQIKIANDKLTSMETQYRRMERKLQSAESELSETRSAKAETARLTQQLQAMQTEQERQRMETAEQLQRLNDENTRLNKLVTTSPTISGNTQDSDKSQMTYGAEQTVQSLSSPAQGRQRGTGDNSSTNTGNTDRRGQSAKSYLDTPVNVQDPYALYAELQNHPQGKITAFNDNGEAVVPEVATSKISVVGELTAPESILPPEISKKHDLYIPVGSMVHGILLNGMYAPTGVNSRKDPFPVVMRIQDEAILPNLKRADLRECFLTLSGYGDMSSERALLRGETLSCIANDDSVLEAKFSAFAVSDADGMSGIRGRLITRNGKALRNAMLAGFASGIGEAFKTTAVPSLDISGSSSATYRDALSSHTLSNGVFNGASQALNKLADYYMSMAEQTFPVVEINPGTEVTVVVSSGVELKTIRESPQETDRLQRLQEATSAHGKPSQGNPPPPAAK